FDGGPHLGDRELCGVELVRRRHGSARRHDLDLVDVAADVLARGPAHLVRPVGDETDHADTAVDRIGPLGAAPLVAVAAGLRDVAAETSRRGPGKWPSSSTMRKP